MKKVRLKHPPPIVSGAALSASMLRLKPSPTRARAGSAPEIDPEPKTKRGQGRAYRTTGTRR